MKIISVAAREIYDSRGNPTIECTVELENGKRAKASVPSGMSRGTHEAFELRDGGIRLMGQGVQKAVQAIETVIAPALMGHDVNFIQVDALLRELDGTENKSVLGGNTILAVSMAVCRAQAIAEQVELYELMAYLCEFETVSLSYPMFNMINGGAHASNHLQVQEFMVIPVGINSFHAAMEAGSDFFHILKKLLEQKGYSTAVGDEGGFAPAFDHEQQALDFLMETIEYMQHEYGISMMIALDVAASQFYDKKMKMYHWQGKLVSSDEMIDWYKKLAETYPLYAIEDGLAEDDWQGWVNLYDALGSKIAIVGDDLFATNAERIYQGIDANVANTVIIKPNQVGTVTEALQAIKLCKAHGKNVIVSHRSGETNDSFIADLAVAASAGQIKAGGLSRGERLAKYNRLLEIENQLLNVIAKNE
jgi:enolase